MSDLSIPAETQPGEYIEAAIHALQANNPRVALGYLVQGFGSRAYGEMLRALPAETHYSVWLGDTDGA